MEKKQQHKNASSDTEQVLVAAPHQAAAVRPPTTHHKTIKVRRTRHVGHFLRSRDELISDVPLRTPSHGRAKTERPARTYIQQLCTDTGCSLEDLHPYSSIDTTAAWKKLRFILTVRSDFQKTGSLSMAVHAFC